MVLVAGLSEVHRVHRLVELPASCNVLDLCPADAFVGEYSPEVPEVVEALLRVQRLVGQVVRDLVQNALLDALGVVHWAEVRLRRVAGVQPLAGLDRRGIHGQLLSDLVEPRDRLVSRRRLVDDPV